MAVNRTRNNSVYGLDNALQVVTPLPIPSDRNPTTSDIAEIGTIWINQAAGAYFILVSVAAGEATWAAQATGSGSFATVTVTGGAGTVLTVDAAGDTDLGGDLAVAGSANITGDLDVDGTATFNGDVDITSTAAISFTSTANAPQAIYLHADGGTASTIEIFNETGDSDPSVYIHSALGGVLLESAGSASNNAINLESSAGGIELHAVLTSTIDVTGAGEDLDILATGGSIHIEATEDSATAVSITASGGASGRVAVLGGGGGVTVAGGGGALALSTTNQAASLNTGTGAINISTDATNTTVSIANGAGQKTVTLGSSTGTSGTVIRSGSTGMSLLSGTGVLSISGDVAATTVHVATGAAAKTLTLGSTNTTSTTTLQSGSGGIDIDATTGAVAIDAVNFEVTVTGGPIALNSDGAISLLTGDAGADITLNASAGRVIIEAGEDAAQSIYLHAQGGTSETILLHADQGTGVASINLVSDVGGLTLRSSGLASNDAINLEAAAGGIDMDAALQINIASSQSLTNAIRIVASDAIFGGIDIDAGGGGIVIDTTSIISLDSAVGSNFTVTGAAQDLTLSSVGGSVNIIATQAAGDAVVINASNAAGGVDILSGTGGIEINSVGAGNITVTAGSGSNGTVAIISTGTGDITLDSDDTMLLDADGVLELNSSAGAISIGNDANNQAINIGTAGQRTLAMGNATAGTTFLLNAPANVGVNLMSLVRIMAGAGSPDGAVTAPAGSLWLRTDPAGATSRAYINTDSGTTWTNFTMAA